MTPTETKKKRTTKADRALLKVEAVKELDADIKHLRSVFREILDTYRVTVEGDLEQVLTTIKEGDEGMTRAQEKTIREMMTRIRAVVVKPKKGRRKDLKKIESLAGQLEILVEKSNW